MTEKRYEIVFLNGLDGLCSIQDTEAKIPTFYNDLGYINHIKPVCNLLNEQEERIKQLESELNNYKPIIFKYDGEDFILYSKKGDVE